MQFLLRAHTRHEPPSRESDHLYFLPISGQSYSGHISQEVQGSGEATNTLNNNKDHLTMTPTLWLHVYIHLHLVFIPLNYPFYYITFHHKSSWPRLKVSIVPILPCFCRRGSIIWLCGVHQNVNTPPPPPTHTYCMTLLITLLSLSLFFSKKQQNNLTQIWNKRSKRGGIDLVKEKKMILKWIHKGKKDAE